MKKLLTIIATLVILLIVIALAAPSFISADRFKQAIIEQVQAKTGRTLTIAGPMKLSFFPVASIGMEQVTLSNPPNFNDKQSFMTLKALNVDVAVLPLLQKDIQIKRLVFDEPQINLQVKGNKKNWEFAEPSAKPSNERDTKTTPSASSSSSPLANLGLNDVKIKNGTVTYNDDAAKSRWDIQKLNTALELKGIASPFTLDASGEWNQKPVKIKAELSTLQSFINKERTQITATVESDLLSINAKGQMEKDVYTGKTAVKSSSLKSLLAWINPGSKPMATPATLALDVKSDMECTTTACALSNATLVLDKIQATGNVKLAMTGKKPDLDVDLATDMLDLNPFLGQLTQAHTSLFFSDAFADNSHWSDAPIDISGLQALNANATIKTGGIIFHSINIGKTVLQAKLKDGMLTADITDAEMYKGKGSVLIALNSSVSPIAMDTRASLKDVQLEPLLKDAAQMDRMTGALDLQISTSTHGRSEQEMISALSGNGQIKINNGSIKRVNLLDMVNNIQSSFASANKGGQETRFSEMGGTFTIIQGIISNRDLSIKSDKLSLGGQGQVDLPSYSIHYRLMPQMMGKAQGGASAEGLGVPVMIEGNLDAPSFRPDISGVLENALQNPEQFKEQLKNSERGIKDQIKDPKEAVKNIKGLLKGLKGH